MTQDKSPIICLMGPTASGKTQAAIELAQRFPCDIISVDSAMVYRGMDIGTAKPSLAERQLAPHRLLDIVDPSQAYSAGQFCTDAIREIREIQNRERIPLLVGGTMLYFRALQQGLSPLPAASPEIRQQLSQEAEAQGWPALYQRLCQIDPQAASRIHSQDKQRIQRALEIHAITGCSLSDFCAQSPPELSSENWLNLALIPEDREALHQKIQQRFDAMLQQGFLEEVQKLQERGDLSADLPALRSVGYRQTWQFLEGKITQAEMREQTIAATRQLAKRQLTWLRTWPQQFPLKTAEITASVIAAAQKLGFGLLSGGENRDSPP